MRSGFTLAELMAAVTIVGILAAMAVPNYRRMVERGYLREAQDLLLTIYNGERVYFFTHDLYRGPLTAASSMTAWREIYMDNPNLGSIPVQFSVAAGAGTFTATAQRNPPAGSPCNATINQDRVVTVSAAWTAGTC